MTSDTSGTSADDNPASTTIFEQLLAQRPLLRATVERFGAMSLLEYFQRIFTEIAGAPQPEPELQRRREELLATLQPLIAKTFDPTIAARATQQLRSFYCVSTSEHHVPLNPAYNLAAALHTASAHPSIDGEPPAVIVFSFGINSLTNSDYPRGIAWHTVSKDAPTLYRLPLLPRQENGQIIARARAYTNGEVQRAQQTLRQAVRQGDLPAHQADQAATFIQSIYAAPDVVQQSRFADQIALSNAHTWQAIGTTLGTQFGPLVYLEIEKVVAALLCQHLLSKPTCIQSLLCDPHYENAVAQIETTVAQYFKQGEIPTAFFWSIDARGRRHPFLKTATDLVDNEQQHHLPRQAAAMVAALEQGTIIPSMLLCYMVLTLYYRLLCLGGINHCTYMQSLNATWGKLVLDVTPTTLPQQRLHYSLLSCVGQFDQYQGYAATGWDILVHTTERADLWKRYSTLIQTAPLRTVLSMTAPDLSDVLNQKINLDIRLPLPLPQPLTPLLI